MAVRGSYRGVFFRGKQAENKRKTSPKQRPNKRGLAMQLSEAFRPKGWEEVVGQETVVQRVQALAKRGLAGRAYWLSGQSGTGKTTIARLIAAEVADEFSTDELDAAALTVS